jgi:amino acid adenylation domain-containing protein
VLLHEQFQLTAERLANQVALVVGDARYTYADLVSRASRLAATLHQRGVKRGDRVIIFTSNSAEMVIAIYAALKIGAIFSPLSPQTKAAKLGYVLRDCTPTCFFADGSLAGVWRPALPSTDSLHTVVVSGSPVTAASHSPGILPFADALTGEGDLTHDPGTIDQDLAAIIYTSGSTGDPKGVMLTHLNMVSAANSITTYLGLREDDTILCALPLSFDYGLYQILMAFKVGSRVVLEQSFAFPVKILEIMEREAVTVFPGVPTMFSMLMALENLSDFPLAHLRMVTNTAAALPERHIVEIRSRFPQAQLFSMYGLTECKRVTYLPPDQLNIRPGSVGRGMPNEEVYLVDEQGNRLPPGSTGELVVRGSNVMRGYWGKPEETAKRLKPGLYPGEFVLHTGDLFRTDNEGYLYFVSRMDDIIKSRGEKVAPKEVENVLYGLEGVLEAAVVGVSDPLLGEVVKAYIVLKPSYAYLERDVVRFCLAHIESFMAPKCVEFVPSLPKTSTGKIDRATLKSHAASTQGAEILGHRDHRGHRDVLAETA